MRQRCVKVIVRKHVRGFGARRALGWNVTSIIQSSAIGRVLTPLLLVDSLLVSEQSVRTTRLAKLTVLSELPVYIIRRDQLIYVPDDIATTCDLRFDMLKRKKLLGEENNYEMRRMRDNEFRITIVWINKFSALSTISLCNELPDRSFDPLPKIWLFKFYYWTLNT